jgi:para-nitrobenzyl esterase
MRSNRLKFIKTLGAGAAGLTLGTSAISLNSETTPPVKKKDEDGQILFIGDNIAVTETTYGKVRGFIHKDIYNFLGIPYGANTAGKNRFMPPQKLDPWKEVYPAV